MPEDGIVQRNCPGLGVTAAPNWGLPSVAGESPVYPGYSEETM